MICENGTSVLHYKSRFKNDRLQIMTIDIIASDVRLFLRRPKISFLKNYYDASKNSFLQIMFDSIVSVWKIPCGVLQARLVLSIHSLEHMYNYTVV